MVVLVCEVVGDVLCGVWMLQGWMLCEVFDLVWVSFGYLLEIECGCKEFFSELFSVICMVLQFLLLVVFIDVGEWMVC